LSDNATLVNGTRGNFNDKTVSYFMLYHNKQK